MFIIKMIKSVKVFAFSYVWFMWKERQMLELVSNVKYVLLLPFLTAAKFYNLGHIQGIKRVQ